MPELPLVVDVDASGEVFEALLEAEMTLSPATLGNTRGVTFLAPTGSDIGVVGHFVIPTDYDSVPALIIRGVVAEAANTLAFGCQFVAVGDDESVDQVYEAADLVNNSTWSGSPPDYAAEDIIELSITLTPGSAFVAGDTVFFNLFRDDSVDDQTGEFYLLSLAFSYTAT
jgi:hypothetical protein